MDLLMMLQILLFKGRSTKLSSSLDLVKIKNSSSMIDYFVNQYPDGTAAGIQSVA